MIKIIMVQIIKPGFTESRDGFSPSGAMNNNILAKFAKI